MDSLKELLIVALVALVIFGATWWILKSVRGKGSAQDFSLEAAALMGHRVILGDGGDKVIGRVLGYNKNVQHVGTNLWTLKADEPEDVLIEWIPNPARGSGGRLLVARAVDKDGVPAGHREWRRLLDVITQYSGESRVMTDRAIGAPLAKSDSTVDGRVVWVRTKD